MAGTPHYHHNKMGSSFPYLADKGVSRNISQHQLHQTEQQQSSPSQYLELPTNKKIPKPSKEL
jgi:hypothetical protein